MIIRQLQVEYSRLRIQQWLEKEHDICLKYEYVHKIVHRHLEAKLKVVRKSNIKKDAALEEKFKKM